MSIIFLTAEYVNEVEILCTATVDGNWRDFYVLVGSTDYTDLLNSGIFIYPIRPSEFHIKDDVNNVWIVDRVAFNPALKEEINRYRDEKIENTAINNEYVTLVFDKADIGGSGTEELGCVPELRSFAAINDKSTLSPIDDVNTTVRFQFSKFTPIDEWDDGYRTVTKAFLQTLYKKMDDQRQVYFDAADHMLIKQRTEPVEFFHEMHADFDAYVTNNI